MDTKLIPIDQIETTHQLYNACDFDEAIDFTTSNGYNKCLSLQRVEYGECNYERKSDWMRFVNKLNNYDETPIKRMITGDKKSLDWGGCVVSREDIKYSEDGFLIEFKQPVNIVVETVGDNYVVVTATKLKGEITWEWSHYRDRHEELDNYAGICEIFLHSIQIIE